MFFGLGLFYVTLVLGFLNGCVLGNDSLVCGFGFIVVSVSLALIVRHELLWCDTVYRLVWWWCCVFWALVASKICLRLRV